MTSLSRKLSLLLSFIQLISLTFITTSTLAQENFLYYNCTYTANFTSPSTYDTNLDTLLPSLASGVDKYGYYNASLGDQPDRVTSVVLCRGDVELDICRSCINDSIKKLAQLCPDQREVISWYDKCMFRYTNQTINFGTMEWGPGFNKWNDKLFVPVEHMDSFFELRRELLVDLRDKASSGDARRKFATGNRQLQNYETIYSLVQCTPDLSATECADCINACMLLIPDGFNNSKGGAVYKPTCNIRYEMGTGTFYNETIAEPPAPPPTTQTIIDPDPKNHTVRNVIIIVVSSVVSMIIVVYILICLRKRNMMQLKKKHRFETVSGISTVESLQYDFDTIKDATNDFSDSNKLGQGGFGPVYKGVLPNGDEFAVKRLSKGSGQGEMEFKNEVLLMAKLQHRNLVRLLGFCLEGAERLLIYEFVLNGSLDHIIFDSEKCKNLDWNKRYKIIGGIAKGLLYLHEDSRLRIIHRDLKASNILLDAEMTAKISDFGMARCFVFDETQRDTSRIAGTYGYMAPEVLQGHISVKTDVFSFGVLVLEIVTGKISKSFGDEENPESLLSCAWTKWREGRASDLIEPFIKNNSGSTHEIMRCIHIGLLCVQENVANRPTMNSVVLMLSSSSYTLAVPTKPAFFMSNSSSGSNMSENGLPLFEPGQNCSENLVTITDLDAR